MAKTRTRKAAAKGKAKAAGTKKKAASARRSKASGKRAKKPASARGRQPKPKVRGAKMSKKTVAKKAVKKVTKKVAKKVAKKAPAPKAVKAKAAKAVKPAAKPKTDAKVRKQPAVAAKVDRATTKAARKAAAAAVVRPLGVLPPSSMKRTRSQAVAQVSFGPRTQTPTTPPPAQGAERVTEQDIKMLEERLLAERQRILREMGHLETNVLKINQRDSAGDLSGYSFHMADSGTDAMEREKAFQFASFEGKALKEINEALRRIYTGVYGICESCGNPIARARLEAIPQARLCVPCKEKEEKAQRGVV